VVIAKRGRAAVVKATGESRGPAGIDLLAPVPGAPAGSHAALDKRKFVLLNTRLFTSVTVAGSIRCYLGDEELCSSLKAVMGPAKFERMVLAGKAADPLQVYERGWSMTPDVAAQLRLAGVQVYVDTADYKPGHLLNIEHTASQYDIDKLSVKTGRDDVKDYKVCFVNFAVAAARPNIIKGSSSVTNWVKPDTLAQRHALCKCRMCLAWRALSPEEQVAAWGVKAWYGRGLGLAPPCEPFLWYPGAPPARG